MGTNREEAENGKACSMLERKLREAVASQPPTPVLGEELAHLQRVLAEGAGTQRRLGRLAEVLALCVRWSYHKVPVDPAESIGPSWRKRVPLKKGTGLVAH